MSFICSGFGVSRDDEAWERGDDREEDGRTELVERDKDGVTRGAY